MLSPPERIDDNKSKVELKLLPSHLRCVFLEKWKKQTNNYWQFIVKGGGDEIT